MKLFLSSITIPTCKMSVQLPLLSQNSNIMSFPRPNANDQETNLVNRKAIAFPEVEELLARDGKLVSKNKPAGNVLAAANARKNFSRMAFKVLSQIIDSSDAPAKDSTTEPPVDATKKEPPEDGKTPRDPEQTDNKPRAKTKGKLSRQSSAASLVGDPKRSSQESLTPRRSKKPASFASLVKLATLKKKMGGPVRKDGSTSSMSKIEEEEELTCFPMPDKPRFCATLSTEAQYAMLKCYEDVLLDNLKTEQVPTGGILYRVKTPHHSVQAIQMSGVSRLPEGATLLPALPSTTPEVTLKPELATSAPPPATPNSSRGDDKIMKDRQLRLSYRFQTAMDILDQLRKSQGQLVTSPRVEQVQISPTRNYNQWSKAWCKEFQFEVRQANGKR